MCQWNGSAFVQIMACSLLGTKPLSKPMLNYCQLDSWEQISVKFELEFYHFHSRKCTRNCRLPRWRPLCPGGNEFTLLWCLWWVTVWMDWCVWSMIKGKCMLTWSHVRTNDRCFIAAQKHHQKNWCFTDWSTILHYHTNHALKTKTWHDTNFVVIRGTGDVFMRTYGATNDAKVGIITSLGFRCTIACLSIRYQPQLYTSAYVLERYVVFTHTKNNRKIC